MLPDSFTPSLLRQLELLDIRTKRRFLGSKQGVHLSLKRGQGIEFSDYRQYQPGDNTRNIDWNVYARNEKLYIKQFREEQDLTALIILDTTRSMFVPQGDNKWEMARDLALSIAYIALMQQDSVLVSALGALHSPKYSGAKAIHSLGTLLTELDIDDIKDVDIVRETQLAAARVRFPGIAVFISDFLNPLDQIAETFNVLKAKNLDITAIQILSGSDINPFTFKNAKLVDSENGSEVELSTSQEIVDEYTYLFNTHNQKLREHLAENRIAFSQITTNEDLTDVILENLMEIGLVA